MVGGQVEQPARVQREPAHHLQRPGGVLLLDRDTAGQPGLDPATAEDVGDGELVRQSYGGR
jgi:hypothetical protein